MTHFQSLTKVNPFEIGSIENSTKIKLFGEEKKMEILENDDFIMSALKAVAQEDISKVIYQIKVSFLRSNIVL